MSEAEAPTVPKRTPDQIRVDATVNTLRMQLQASNDMLVQTNAELVVTQEALKDMTDALSTLQDQYEKLAAQRVKDMAGADAVELSAEQAAQ